MSRVAYNRNQSHVRKICVVPCAIEQVNLVSRRGGMQHTTLAEMIVWPLPVKSVSIQAISVLLKRVLFFFGDKENDLVVVLRSNDAACDSVIAGIAPKICEGVARVLTPACDF